MVDFTELKLDDLQQVTATVDAETYRVADKIINEVSSRGESALREYGQQFDGLSEGESLFADRSELKSAAEQIPSETRDLLIRVCDRIKSFAIAQRQTFSDLQVSIPGGKAGHRWVPLQAAGCYAPGGRYPLPSSVLMTAATAKTAGVADVWVASPNPNSTTLAAAFIAGADGMLKLGGAQAIAAMAIGFDDLPACDVIVGPGNRFVTAAKSIISKTTRIDSLAGPSELVVVAGDDADPAWIAADLLAQAEHDVDARPILITTCSDTVQRVKTELTAQMTTLSTASIAAEALKAGGYLRVGSMIEAADACNQIAPEHLSLQGAQAADAEENFKSGAALFIGSQTAEVFGDYGAGPNHVLPTGGAARSQSALSVLNFMRFQTTLNLDNAADAQSLIADAAALGRLEGLEAHARSSECRLAPSSATN